MIKGKLLFTLPACALLVVAACSIRPPSFPGSSDNDSAPTRRLDPNSIADAVPRAERRSRRGNADSYVVLGKRYHVMANSDGFSQRGIASWYGTKFHGRTTSSGEVYDMYAMTAAHKSLPLPTYVEVTNLNNGRHTIVKVNDRGPFHNNRIIDLSYAAATKLGILGKGTGLVEIRAINPRRPTAHTAKAVIDKPPGRGLFIQVGAFSSSHNAHQLRQRLEGTLNQSIRIQQAQQRGEAVYRVQVGPLASVPMADTISQQLAAMGIVDTRIILD